MYMVAHKSIFGQIFYRYIKCVIENMSKFHFVTSMYIFELLYDFTNIIKAMSCYNASTISNCFV